MMICWWWWKRWKEPYNLIKVGVFKLTGLPCPSSRTCFQVSSKFFLITLLAEIVNLALMIRIYLDCQLLQPNDRLRRSERIWDLHTTAGCRRCSQVAKHLFLLVLEMGWDPNKHLVVLRDLGHEDSTFGHQRHDVLWSWINMVRSSICGPRS